MIVLHYTCMDNITLKALVDNLCTLSKENETIEFKENCLEKNKLGQLISALTNSAIFLKKRCAYIVFGVQDRDHTVVGTSFSFRHEKVGNEELEHWLQQHLEPKVNFSVYEFSYDNNKSVVLFEILPGTAPTAFNNIRYIRIGGTTRKLQDYPEKERVIWDNLQNESFEERIAKESVTSSDVLSLLGYSEYFSLFNMNPPEMTEGFIEKMEQDSIVKQSSSGVYNITNLGAILLARDVRQFTSVQKKVVRIIVFDGVSKQKVISDKEMFVGYAINLQNVIEYISMQIPSSEEISKLFRKETKMYPNIAIREFVVNALIHQDLSISGMCPMIEIFKDRIEISNPGKPLIEVDRFIDHSPHPRNEKLASFMHRGRTL